MTLRRVLEPEVMDTPEEASDYNSMDHSAVNRVFVDDLLAAGDVTGDVLDLGTGTALIPIELARRHDACRILAVDMSINMLELARYNIEIAGLIQRIQLAHIDAKRLPYRDGTFAVTMSNSIVHHIPDPRPVLEDAIRVTAADGRLFFRDLVRPDSQKQLEELVAQYAGNENEHSRKMFADSLHAALSLDEIRSLVQQLGFSPQTVNMTSDRHWTWSAQRG